jgi:DNA-directed RNA polymerase specialized sigma24 family protein
LKDQIQELFVELWNSRKNLAPARSVKFYLFKALRYKLIKLEKFRYLSQQSGQRSSYW